MTDNIDIQLMWDTSNVSQVLFGNTNLNDKQNWLLALPDNTEFT